MPEILDLQDNINDTIGIAAFTALKHFDEHRQEDAAAIISEWTTESGEVILTHWFDETMENVEDYLLWANLSDSEILYGDYSFQPLD